MFTINLEDGREAPSKASKFINEQSFGYNLNVKVQLHAVGVSTP